MAGSLSTFGRLWRVLFEDTPYTRVTAYGPPSYHRPSTEIVTNVRDGRSDDQRAAACDEGGRLARVRSLMRCGIWQPDAPTLAIDVSEPHPIGRNSHGPEHDRKREPTRSQGPGIEDRHTRVDPDERNVGMTAHDQGYTLGTGHTGDVGAKLWSVQSDVNEQKTQAWLRVAADLQSQGIGQVCAAAVDVASHGEERGEMRELFEYREIANVARMKDRVRSQRCEPFDGTRMRPRVCVQPRRRQQPSRRREGAWSRGPFGIPDVLEVSRPDVQKRPCSEMPARSSPTSGTAVTPTVAVAKRGSTKMRARPPATSAPPATNATVDQRPSVSIVS